MSSKWVMIAAINGLIAVAAGAFGAHVLADRLTPRELNAFEVGVRYQMYHALALLLVAWMVSTRASAVLSYAAAFLLAGIVLFSGSLYVLALTGLKWFGMITPIGGVSFLVGWLLIAVSARRAAIGHTHPQT